MFCCVRKWSISDVMGNLDWNLFDCILLWCVPKRRYSIEDAGKLILLSNYLGLKCMNGVT